MKDKQRSTSQVEDKHTPGPWKAIGNKIYSADRAVAHFEDRFGVVIDHPVSRNLASLRFASDHLAYTNFGAEPYPY